MKDNLFSFKDLSQDLQIGYWVILGYIGKWAKGLHS